MGTGKLKKQSTNFPGVRYYEHQTRRHGVGRDRYFSIRYQKDGKRMEEGVGWASRGWTPKKVAILLNDLKKNHLTGEGAQSLAEKRKAERDRRKREQNKKKRLTMEMISFGQFFEESYFPIAKMNKKPESYRKEMEHFRNWINPVIGGIPLKKIYPLNLERIKKNMLNAGRSARLIQYVFATIRQTWNIARRDGLVERESPTKQVKLPKINNQRLRFLTHAEADSLLDHLKIRSRQLHNISLLSLHSGLRAGEIFRLRWGCIHLDRGVLDVLDGKGTKDRTAYLTQKTKEMFEGLESGNHNELVFPDRNGKKIGKISNAFSRAVDELKLNDGVEDRRQKVVFHTCRHTYASWLVQGGESLYTVQKLMGHSTLSQTERYSHLAEENLEGAVHNFETSISKKSRQSKRKETKAVKMERGR